VPSRLRAEFQPRELSEVLEHYDLGAILRIDEQRKGSRRAPKVLITSDDGRFLLKRRARGRDHPLKVAFAHAVQEYLAENDFPLARLVRTVDDDDTMVIINDLIYEMFEVVSGERYDHSLEATASAGRVLGRFHQLMEDYESEWEPARRGYHDANVVRSNLNEMPASIGKDDSVIGKETELLVTVSTLYELYENAAERIDEAGYFDWPDQIVHCDWHPGNILFEESRVVAVMDYDSLHILPAVTDLANGALQFSIIGGNSDPRLWPAELDVKRFRHFVHSYREKVKTPPEQMAVLPSLMIEALVAEAVMPIAATGSFGRIEGFRFLQMILRKVRWLELNGEQLMKRS